MQTSPILGYQPGGGVGGGDIIPLPPSATGVLDSGIAPLVNGQSYVDVVFAPPMTDANWTFLECRPFNVIDANPLNIWPGIVTSKTASGFRLQLNGLPDSSNYYLNWSIIGVALPPVPATTYTFTGPTSGTIGTAYTFTVALPGGSTTSGSVTITPSDGGGGGVFSPGSVMISTAVPSATFTYTPGSYGTKTLSVANDGALANPASIMFSVPSATGYSMTGPPSGLVSVASTPFTVTLTPGGLGVPSPVVVTPSSGGGGGTFTPTTVTLSTGSPSTTFTYTPASIGTKTISATNSGGLTDPSSLTYTVTAPFDPTSIAGLKLWLKADGIAGPPADGTLLSAWNDSSSTGYNLGNAGGSERPTFKTSIVNGKPVVRFDGVANRLYNASLISVSQPFTIFVVGNSTTLNDCRWLHASGATVVLIGMDSSGGYIEIYAGAGAGFLHAASPTDQHGAFHQWTAIFNSTVSSIYSDGSLIVTGDSGTNAIPQVGVMTDGTAGTVHSTGDVAEILVYNSALGTTDRTNVQNYLKAKYNTP